MFLSFRSRRMGRSKTSRTDNVGIFGIYLPTPRGGQFHGDRQQNAASPPQKPIHCSPLSHWDSNICNYRHKRPILDSQVTLVPCSSVTDAKLRTPGWCRLHCNQICLCVSVCETTHKCYTALPQPHALFKVKMTAENERTLLAASCIVPEAWELSQVSQSGGP